jgi:hypothetical protein
MTALLFIDFVLLFVMVVMVVIAYAKNQHERQQNVRETPNLKDEVPQMKQKRGENRASPRGRVAHHSGFSLVRSRRGKRLSI